MHITHQAQLREYNTFGIASIADTLVTLHDTADFVDLVKSRRLQSAPHFVLGGGSNVILPSQYHGTIVRIANEGVTTHTAATSDHVLVEAAAGTAWDSLVRHTLHLGLYGMENLIAIPGTVGASAVQNVGAYGVEAKDIIYQVRAIEIATGHWRTFSVAECQLGYRDSIFKHALSGQYLIASVVFRLSTSYRPILSYKGITDRLQAHGITHPTALEVATTVEQLRQTKLPDPHTIGSAGSFFKNPIVDASQYHELKAHHPDLAAFPLDTDHYKVSAAWLIEHAGWKGRTLGKVGVYERQPLVLVNLGGCTANEVRAVADAIIADIRSHFGITLVPEALFV